MRKLTLLFIFSLLFVSCKKEEYITPKRINMTESIYSSVIIQPDSLYQVYAVISGILEKIVVEEGDRITKNQTLFKVINTTPELNAKNAKLALDLANDNYSGGINVLQSIKDEINAAHLKYKNDSINYFRQKNLWDQKIGSKIEFDTKKLNYDLAKNNLKYNPKYLLNSIFIEPTDIYKDETRELTRKNLRRLNNFRSVDIKYEETEDDMLNANIFLTPLKKYSIGFNTELTHSNIRQLGVSGKLSFLNRNIFFHKWIFFKIYSDVQICPLKF